jgi:hypothetical protein
VKGTGVRLDDRDALRREVRIIPVASGALFGRRVRAGFIYRVAGNGVNGPLGDGWERCRQLIVGPIECMTGVPLPDRPLKVA